MLCYAPIKQHGKFPASKKLTKNLATLNYLSVTTFTKFNMTTIDNLVSEFQNRVGKRTTKTTATFIADFKTVVAAFLEKESKEKKTSSSKGKKDESDKKLNTWARIWVSTKYGGKTRFPDDYTRIKEEAEASGNKLTSFQILSKLRTELEEEEGRERWEEWYKWVQEENTDAPEDPPTDRTARQPKKEVK